MTQLTINTHRFDYYDHKSSSLEGRGTLIILVYRYVYFLRGPYVSLTTRP